MKYEIYLRADRDFGWRLLARNGKTIAVSGEGYKNKQDCRAGILLVKTSTAAPIKDTTIIPTLDALKTLDIFRKLRQDKVRRSTFSALRSPR